MMGISWAQVTFDGWAQIELRYDALDAPQGDNRVRISVPVHAVSTVGTMTLLADAEVLKAAIAHATNDAARFALRQLKDLEFYPEKEKADGPTT